MSPPPSAAVLSALLSALARVVCVCLVHVSDRSEWALLRGLLVFALGVSSWPFLRSASAVARALATNQACAGGEGKVSTANLGLHEQARFLGGVALAIWVGADPDSSTGAIAFRLGLLLLTVDALGWVVHAGSLFVPWLANLVEEARARHKARWALAATVPKDAPSAAAAPSSGPPPSPPTSPPPMPPPTATTAAAKGGGKLESALFGKLLEPSHATPKQQSVRTVGGALKLRVVS